MHLIKNLNKKQRIIFFILSAIILVGIIYFIVVSISRIGKIPITVQYAPFEANITLNGTKINNHTTVWLEPGKYLAKIEFDHFKTIEREVEITDKYRYIVGIMEATDSNGEEYANSHRQEFIETEGVIGQALNQEGKEIKERYPILNYLPINNRLYSISYIYNNNTAPTIAIKAAPEYLDAAVQKIKNLEDVDPTIYQIDFTATNPYTTYTESPKASPEETIKASFTLSDTYKLSEGEYIAGEYYVATLYKYDYDKDLICAHYRVLLKKTNDKWHILATPQPLLTRKNTPKAPKDILYYANAFEP
ncbi:hypothetical protein IKQ74_00970 [Candidatus Saccharibacteria bacterium]|nr:hypothetical protein [Candidatus Saccharibacteria bacterium]